MATRKKRGSKSSGSAPSSKSSGGGSSQSSRRGEMPGGEMRAATGTRGGTTEMPGGGADMDSSKSVAHGAMRSIAAQSMDMKGGAKAGMMPGEASGMSHASGAMTSGTETHGLRGTDMPTSASQSVDDREMPAGAMGHPNS